MDIKLFFSGILYSLKNILIPQAPAAGLEFKDAAVRLIKFSSRGGPALGWKNNLPAQAENFDKAAVMLEPGIIDNGKIKDRDKLLSALRKLRDQIDSKEKIPVIAIIPSVNVYTKSFSTPILDQKSLEEAALLNLKSISPIDFSKGYSDWQEVGFKERDGKIDVLGAFADGAVVDGYADVLRETGFAPVAVEFSALAIARMIKESGTGIDLEKPQEVVNIASDGIDFMVIRGGDLHFDYFVPWKLIQEEGKIERAILFEDFKDTVVREVKKVSNFYGSHWGGKIENLILISQALNAEISDLIQKNFQFKVIDLRFDKYADLQASWFAVLGSALRGLMPRHSDILISLMAVGTEKLSLQSEIIIFAKTWRNIIVTILVFLAVLFISVDSFLAHVSVDLADQSQKVAQVSGGGEIAVLQQQVRLFNQLVEKVSLANQQKSDLTSFLAEFNKALNGKLKLTRISVDANQSNVTVLGEAGDESAAIDFKNDLEAGGFKNVLLPFSNLVAKAGGGVTFSITFNLLK